MTIPSKMEVNAAIETMIAGADKQAKAARVVVAYGNSLTVSSMFVIEVRGDKKSHDDAVSGHTNELGDVEIKDTQESQPFEKSWGVHKDRVGHYRLWREKKDLIVFHHFWKSNLSTQNLNETLPDEYYLYYDKISLEPLFFGVKRERVLFRIGTFITFSQFYLEPIYGTRSKLHLLWGVSLRN